MHSNARTVVCISPNMRKLRDPWCQVYFDRLATQTCLPAPNDEAALGVKNLSGGLVLLRATKVQRSAAAIACGCRAGATLKASRYRSQAQLGHGAFDPDGCFL